MMGFTTAHARAQARLEEEFKALISREQERNFHRYFTAEPHPAGSRRNNELAAYIAQTWRQQGLESIVIHRYDVLSSFPRQITVELVSPIVYRAGLREDAYEVDPDTRNPHISAAYCGLSASGEVTAPVVYAHSGNPEDYDLLRKNGIDVRGKIVLVRYSNPYSYRGFKALTAQREGAAGILIYSDPAEDGYKRGKVFPDGPWGPESHIQRGAITYDFLGAGDPLTPGWASLPGAERLPIALAPSVPKIMGVPLSWRDARPLLEHMGGPVAPREWQGGLPFTYRFGGQARVHLKVDVDTRVMPNYVVEARIGGARQPDEWLLLGNHRDAWAFGGVDPSSGTAAMMEMTAALGRLLRQGVRPLRTLIVCSWDGEEVGLTGSTEWGEQFASELKRKLVAYINVDSATSGPDFEPTAVASLAPFLVDAAHALRDPSGVSLYEAWKRSTIKTRAAERNPHPVDDASLVNTRVGSGSDHTVFLNFLCRPTIELQFNGPYGVYHSAYDDFYWMNHFGDPGYRYHVLMSQLWGVLALRLANADILSFDFANYAENIRQFVDELENAHKQSAQNLDLGRLRQAISEFEDAGRDLRQTIDNVLASGQLDSRRTQALNAAAMQVEGTWLSPTGIPGRPWFKHVIYGTRYTYAHLELPGLTEAVEAGNYALARQQEKVIEEALRQNSRLLRQLVRRPH